MSLAAGVLTAALALPPQGLVAAYDFARTNFANWSEDLTQSAWGKSSSSVTLVQQQLADGSLGTVSKLLDTTANAQHLVSSGTFIPADNAPQSFVWRVKAAEYQYVGVQWSNKTNTIYPTNIVDLVAGVILNSTTGTSFGTTITATSGGFPYTLTVVSAGNGWWDLILNIPSVGAGNNSPRPALLLQNQATNSNGFTFAGTGTNGVLIQRVQWNGTLAPAPYERTTDGQTLIDRSVRLWPAPAARTNGVNWSEDFTQASWNKAGCTVNAGSTVTTTYNDQTVTLTRYTATNGSQAGNGLTGGGGPGLAVTAGQMVYASVFASPIDSPSTGIVISTGLTQLFVVFNFATQTFTNVAGVAASAQYELLPNGVYRLTVGWIATGTMTVRTHVGYASGLTSVYLGGASMSTGLLYEKTTDGATYDFSLKGRNLLPNSDLAGAAGAAPIGWAASNATSISYGADGSMTFTATARFGSVFVHSSLVPVAGRPFTMSVDLTSGAGRLVPYLYDHNGTYLTVLGSTPVNGRAVLQVNRTDVYRVEFRIEDDRASGWTPITFRRPMLELGLTDGGYQASARHGTLGSSTNPDSNDPVWTPQGLAFDGVDDFVAVPGPAGETGETLIFRVPSNTNRAGEVATVYSQGQQSGGPTPYLWVYYVSNAITIQLADGQDRVTNSFSAVAPGTLVAITADYASGRIRYYENGTLRSAVTHIRPFLPVRSAVARIGCYSISLTHTASGTQSWLSRHTRALTDAEVHQAYRFIRNQLSIKRGITI